MALTKVTGGLLGNLPTGTDNVAVGDTALDSIESGAQYNVAIGSAAGTAITTGDKSTIVGALAGTALTSGEQNTALGYAALFSDTQGKYTTAVGWGVLQSQNFTSDTATYNTAVGYNAGAAVTTGVQNTLIGALAGDAITTGVQNVAVGYNALSTEDGHGGNVAVGVSALSTQNAGADAYNTGVGHVAGAALTTGVQNTLIGAFSGDAVTTGGYNCIMGYQAGTYLVDLTTGTSNCIIGAYARTTAVSSQNANIFGSELSGAGGFTTVGYQSSDIRTAHGSASWAPVSDQRFKKDITDATAGLSFINALRPRTYNYRTLSELPETFNAYKEGSTEVFKNTKTNHGFIAQEVKEAIDADEGIKNGFEMWGQREDGAQEVAESSLIPILVKAIQEQSALITSLTDRIAALEA